MIQDDPVVVVDNLSLVTELDRLTQPALGDRPGLRVVQADHPGGTVRGDPGQAEPGLPDDPFGRSDQRLQVVDRPDQASTASPRRGIRCTGSRPRGRLGPGPTGRAAGVDQQLARVLDRGLGQVGQLPGDLPHAGPGPIRAQLRPGPQLGGDAVRLRCRPLGTGPAAWVRTAPPAAWIRLTLTPIRRTALANRPESVGYATFAGTTVVSARTRLVRNTFASTALTSNASFNPSTAALPHRVVSFISVVGCGTAPSNGIRQNRRHVIESVTSRHNDSYPSRYRNFRNINRRYVSIGVDGRPIRGSKNGSNGPKNTGSSSSASTRASSSGSRSTSGGSTASHSDT